MIKEFLKKSTEKREENVLKNRKSRRNVELSRSGVEERERQNYIYLQIFGVSEPLCGVVHDIS